MITRRRWLLTCMGLGIAPLFACSRPPQAFQETIAVFGTLVKLTVYAQQPEQASRAFAAVNTRFQQIHHEWHAWEKGGLVSKINAAIAQGESIEVSEEVAQFIQRNQQLCRQTNGLFDPGIGKLIKLWGFQQNSYEHNRAPSAESLAEVLAYRASILDLHWQGNQLSSSNNKVALDFGASGKAYALDAATQTLTQEGIRQATVMIGGDIQVLGEKPDGPWRIGIKDPLNPNLAKASLSLASGEAACSSGTYERFYTDQGKKVSHIIHPHSGQPVTHLLHSTAIHHDALIAEVAALAQLIAGSEGWQSIAQNLGVKYSYLIDNDGRAFISTALNQRLH
ncbi:MAG: FAD:protein FMN transferase [Gammaproteobacteria bacterium]|nr:FAD:protein FMN transferase [Gammaproteobacteria bacterium]